MEITVKRRPSTLACTISELWVDGSLECFSLEDVVRERAGERVSAWKVPGDTAIPAGRYRVVITPSARFKRDLPLLLDVPGFAGIRLHPGNTAADTEGCLLVGDNVVGDTVTGSRSAFNRLFDQIEEALGDVQSAGEDNQTDKGRYAPAWKHPVVDLQHEDRSGQIEQVDHAAHDADADERAAAGAQRIAEFGTPDTGSGCHQS